MKHSRLIWAGIIGLLLCIAIPLSIHHVMELAEESEESVPELGNLNSTIFSISEPEPEEEEESQKLEVEVLLTILAVLNLASLLITLWTRSPVAFGVTILLAVIELSLIILGIGGIII